MCTFATLLHDFRRRLFRKSTCTLCYRLFSVDANGYVILLAEPKAYKEIEYEFTLTLLDNVHPKKTATTEIHVFFSGLPPTAGYTLVWLLAGGIGFGLSLIIIILYIVIRKFSIHQQKLQTKRQVLGYTDVPKSAIRQQYIELKIM